MTFDLLGHNTTMYTIHRFQENEKYEHYEQM